MTRHQKIHWVECGVKGEKLRRNYVMEARRPDLILVAKKAKSCVIIDVAVPGDCRIREKEIMKIEKYQNLKRELKRLWPLKQVGVVPVVVGALECISKGFSGWMDILGIKLNVGVVQKSVLLETARIQLGC